MEQKRAVGAKLSAKYRGCTSQKERAAILEQMVELSGYDRHYAAWVLRHFGTSRVIQTPAGEAVRLVVGCKNRRRAVVRSCTYDQAVKEVLVLLWESFDQMCGKRLVAILPEVLPILQRRGGSPLNEVVYQKLKGISAATIDRLLKGERAKRRLKGIAHTTPSTALKSRVPMRISSELPVQEPGHFQIDLVGHEGGNPNGHFAFTLDAVELYSGWVEPRIVLNKAHRWVKTAVESIQSTAVVPIKSLHSDNDSAFINEPLQSWCSTAQIEFYRGRPWHSNDTCYVEQKNYNIVRQAVGYARYETEEEIAVIAALYEKLRLLINFFYPSMKLLHKSRQGARVHKSYDAPRTPARRLLDCPTVADSVKGQLRWQLDRLDPFQLKGQIAGLQDQLMEMIRKKCQQILYPGPLNAYRKLWLPHTLYG
jgi:hypothetical protein